MTTPKCTKMHLEARMCLDPLRELTAPQTPHPNSGAKRGGKEAEGKGREFVLSRF